MTIVSEFFKKERRLSEDREDICLQGDAFSFKFCETVSTSTPQAQSAVKMRVASQ